MVVGYLLVLEDSSGLPDPLAPQDLGLFRITGQAGKDRRYFVIDISGEIGGIHPRIGDQLLLVQALGDLERIICRIAEFLVAIHLQTGQVKQLGSVFQALLFLCGNNFKLFFAHLFKQGLALRLVREPAFLAGEDRVAVGSLQGPIGLRFEIQDAQVALHDHGQSGGLHPAHG